MSRKRSERPGKPWGTVFYQADASAHLAGKTFRVWIKTDPHRITEDRIVDLACGNRYRYSRALSYGVEVWAEEIAGETEEEGEG